MLSFKPEHCQPSLNDGKGNYRMDFASQWMDLISKRNLDFGPQSNVTRWHVEIEGDNDGKYLSNIQLISYYQFDLNTPRICRTYSISLKKA